MLEHYKCMQIELKWIAIGTLELKKSTKSGGSPLGYSGKSGAFLTLKLLWLTPHAADLFGDLFFMVALGSGSIGHGTKCYAKVTCRVLGSSHERRIQATLHV